MILERWKQADSVVRGTSHIATGEVCQDRTFHLAKNGITAIALSDGAGSKKLSHFGAEIAVRAVCKLLCERFDEIAPMCETERGREAAAETVLGAVLAQLEEMALEKSVAVQELAGTLLFFAKKGSIFISGHIGDGCIGVWDGQGDYIELLSEPENGTQSNITFFLVDADAKKHLRIMGGDREDIRGVILMSDGSAELLLEKNKLFHQNTVNLFKNYHNQTRVEYQNTLESFLSKTVAQYSDDDLSINVLVLERLSSEEKVSEAALKELVTGVKSRAQIVPVSMRGRLILDGRDWQPVDFNSPEEVLNYLQFKPRGEVYGKG